MRRIKHFFFLVCLLVAGAQSAGAQKTCTFNNCTYNLYEGYTFTYQGVLVTVQPYAVLTGIYGTAQDVVVPYSLEDGGTTYYVSRGSGTISNDNVKTLTFKSNFSFSTTCYLSCSQLTKIVFERGVDFEYSGQARLKCASLTDIVFKGEVPALSGSWSNYCTAPVGNVTAHVAAWTAEECINKHESNTTVWHDFADIVPYNEGVEETVKVSVTVERASFTGMTSSETISTGNTSSAVYERSKRSNYTFTIDPDFSISMYNLEAVYVNGKDITANLTDVDGKKRYTIEDLRDDVFIRVVGGRKNCYIAVAVDDGGTVGWDGFSVTNMTSIGTVPKATGKEFTITPKEGYEFDRCWLTGWNVAVQYPDYLVSQGDGSYKLTIPSIDMDETTLSVSFKPLGKPVWTISQSDDCPTVKMSIITSGGTSSSKSLMNHFVRWSDEIDPTSTYWLLVAKDDDGRPVSVQCNGADVTYNYDVDHSNSNFLFYTMDPTKDESWEISYDTRRRQTFVVKGGTTEQVVEMEYEHLYGSPVLHANNNGIPASAYLPPFDNEYNSYVYLTFYVKEGETATIFRNGVDVTDKFERGRTYYDLQINDADYDNNNTLSALGFDIREPATWEITIDDLYSVHHEVTLVGSENNNVTFDYQDANGDHEDAFSSKHGIFKTPPYDYNSYNTFMLDVDVKTGEKLHVFCNGEEVTEGLVLISTATDGTKTYEFYADDPETNYIMAELDINVFEGCSWVILIDDGSGKFDVNGDGEINVSDVTALVSKILHP